MPVKKEPSGRRSVEAEVEVPGTPEEVWRAIATGPGISSWFVPSEVEERVGGAAVSHFAADGSMDSVGTVVAWEPPRRFVVETEGGPGTVASEWTVEARAGGSCVVRVVHAWFASDDAWDEQFEGHQQGWPAFFRILRLLLTHFRGQPCAAFQLMATAAGPKEAAWAALAGPLGLHGTVVGARFQTADDAPCLAGLVEHVDPAGQPEERLLRIDEPAPGLVHLFALEMGGQVYLPVRVFLYGEGASAVAAREAPAWQAWLGERFPSGDASAS